MTIEEMKKRKIELGLSNEMLAEQSGVPLGTLQKIFSGVTKAPRKATIDALTKVLSPAPSANVQSANMPSTNAASVNIPSANGAGTAGYDSGNYTGGDPGRFGVHEALNYPNIVAESVAAYDTAMISADSSGSDSRFKRQKRQGEYTLEDYYALPDERRVELIDGVIYDMTAPSVRHQLILGELYAQFLGCPRIQSGECTVFLSPSDVQLDCDNRTMVQPDIFIICGKIDLDASHTMGAPDLAIEILSPSTRSKDMLLKLHKYYNAGVQEYWIIDPKHKIVLVYDLTDDTLYPDKYDFNSIVPVKLSGGECKIDFSKISRKVFPTE